MNTSKPIILFACLIFSLQSYAAHIIGGEINYVCNGNDNYSFTMKIYRDCDGGGAPFDGAPGAPFPATLTVYRGSGNNFTIFDEFTISNPTVNPVLPNLSDPCLVVPSNVCVEEGIYNFSLNLPASALSYHVVYQRCCRNDFITNITNPGAAGATYSTEITPLAQTECNNSPVFDNFPPIVICAGEDINFEHSATDPDGDQLIYTFCSPFYGGGQDQNNPTQIFGVAPQPDAPPPFTNVIFNAGFSGTNPMTADPALQINPSTGLITGVPTVIGQYVVGVCVDEFRNGQLIGRSFRDFQFNVTNCDPFVLASIEADDVLGEQEFLVLSCGQSTVKFNNLSTLQQNIDENLWVFDINGMDVTSNEWDATIDFPGVGSYEGFLFLNPGTECSDTANITVNIFPEMTADFEFDYDTCVSGPVQFTDLSVSDAGPNAVVSWDWAFGDGNDSDLQNPAHLYMEPGNIPVLLTATDSNDCVDTITQIINYFPVPALIVISPSTFNGCAPADIFFDNLSFPIDSTYQIDWTFGDGGTSVDISPTHLYDSVGLYTVSVDITSPLGCQTDTTFVDLINVRPSPTAGFSFSPDEPSNFRPDIDFIDESIESVAWIWEFDEFGFSPAQNPSFTFPDTGMFNVTQIVFHESGCPDTAMTVIDVEPKVQYFMPNAFTPNGDGINDIFGGVGVMEGARQFNFSIYNRFGEEIFQTGDPFTEWNGRKNNTGRYSPQGVYLYIVNYITPRGVAIEEKGYVTLIR